MGMLQPTLACKTENIYLFFSAGIDPFNGGSVKFWNQESDNNVHEIIELMSLHGKKPIRYLLSIKDVFEQ
jgi:hypothetical protein